jgi:dephospho-CoA kinase
MLAENGAATIDADQVYRRLIEPGLPLWRTLVERFGQEILGPDRRIDRRALGAIVFSDPAALADLDRLSHPAVIAAIEAEIGRSPASVIAVDAVKLVESGMGALCDRVWLVTCPPEQQMERLMRRNHLPKEEAERRIAAQPPLGPKLARADLVLDNSASRADLHRQVAAAWAALPSRSAGPGEGASTPRAP